MRNRGSGAWLDVQGKRALALEGGARFGGNRLVGFPGAERGMAGVGVGRAGGEQGAVEHPLDLGQALGNRPDFGRDFARIGLLVGPVQDRGKAGIDDAREHRVFAQSALGGEAGKDAVLRRIEPHGLGAGAHDAASVEMRSAIAKNGGIAPLPMASR